MGFAFPEAFGLLALLPFLVRAYRAGDRRAGSTLAAFRGRPPGRWRATARLALMALFIGALVTVAARPYVEARQTGSFLFLVDVTRSMNARYACGEPTFLERAKRVMQDVIQDIPEAGFAIFAFDRLAFPVTQLTRDRAYLEQTIAYGLYVGLTYDATATNLANALSVVAGKKQRLPAFYGDISHLILLSDGFLEGNYQARMRVPFTELEQNGLHVVSVGIGNPGDTPVPMVTDRGECLKSNHTDIQGNTIQVRLRDDILSFIAAGTGGVYFGESQADQLIEYLRTTGLKPMAEDAETSQIRRRDISGGFVIIALLSLFGLLLLKTFSR